MITPQEIRQRIEVCRADLARAEGQQQTLQGEIDQGMVRLRKVLKCKAGGEKTSIEALRGKIDRDSQTLEALLDRAEALRAT